MVEDGRCYVRWCDNAYNRRPHVVDAETGMVAHRQTISHGDNWVIEEGDGWWVVLEAVGDRADDQVDDPRLAVHLRNWHPGYSWDDAEEAARFAAAVALGAVKLAACRG